MKTPFILEKSSFIREKGGKTHFLRFSFLASFFVFNFGC